MTRRTDAGRLAPIIGIASALVVLGATAAPWIEEPLTRAIRDVTVSEVRVMSGFEFSPWAPVAALAGLVCSFGLLLSADRVRRVASAALFAAGVGAVAAVAVGVARIMGLHGAPTATPLLALVGGAAMVGAAVLGGVGVGRSAQRLPARYDVDASPGDDEWEIASDTTRPRRELPLTGVDGRQGMSGFLAQVCAEAAERVTDARRREPLAALRERAEATPRPPPFGAALEGGGIIAEVKRASPSRGVIAADCDAVAQARAYAAGGAAAISVLTEPAHFLGGLGDLEGVAAAVDLPVLRKDFIVDAYQLFEARAAGAAAALLLVGALDDSRLVDLIGAADEAGIEVLIETHDATEVTRTTAVLAHLDRDRPAVVGVNARDLTRLSVDRSRFTDLVGGLPGGVVVVAESGVTGPVDVTDYRHAGAHAVLVGEHLMRADDPAATTRALATAVQRSPAELPDPI